MPQRGKTKRTAARQTQLGQHKRRQSKGPSGIPVAVEHAEAVPVEEAESTLEGRDGPLPRPSPIQRPSSVAASRGPEPRSAVYAYVAPELKRILLFSSGTFTILIALTFLLR